MSQAWYTDNDTTSDQRLEHHRNPPEFVTFEEIYKKIGLEYYRLNVDTCETDGSLDKIKKAHGYNFETLTIVNKESCTNFEKLLKDIYTEHIHPNEESRFFVDGSGYFDVRDLDENWIRIAVSTGDMLILPGGLYHRFTLDFKGGIKIKSYFPDEPASKTETFYRPHGENMECRKKFLEKFDHGTYSCENNLVH